MATHNLLFIWYHWYDVKKTIGTLSIPCKSWSGLAVCEGVGLPDNELPVLEVFVALSVMGCGVA